MIGLPALASRRLPGRQQTPRDKRSGVFPKTAAGLTAIAMAVVVAGCTSSSPKPAPTGASASSSATAATRPPTQNQLPSPSAIRNDVKLHRQTAITSCTSKPGGWQASGKSVNPGKNDVHLTITVFFTTTTATVLDYATTKVTVPAGGTAKWTAAATFPAQPTMLCVLRGVG
jgi:hypothetical protein